VKQFAIRRELSPLATWEDADVGALQTLVHTGLAAASVLMEPRVFEVSWVRTYWEQGSGWGTCLFTGRDAAQVLQWHEICSVPYAEIREVEIIESTRRSYRRGFHARAEEAPLVAVELCAGAAARPGKGWIRTYRDLESGNELRLFLATGAAPATNGGVHRVVEYGPNDYL
jgi:hypothetical protein